jgi:endonuclease III
MIDMKVKYDELDPLDKKKVEQLIDTLLSKKSKKKPFDMTAYQKKIQDIPTWSEEDIKELEENIKHFGSWKIEQW